MTTTWQVTQTDYDIATGFIFCAHWTATATDGAYSASAYSTCSFAAATPSIPYASVTEQDVLNWIWANGVGKDTVEASLQSQIDLLKNPVQAAGVPWSTTA